MNFPAATLEINVTRSIPAPPAEVYDAWFDPNVPGNVWHGSEQLAFDLGVERPFYVRHVLKDGTQIPHFGRFTVLERGRRAEHTWMSPVTRGLESKVTVTFEKEGDGTKLTLKHVGLPDDELGRLHEMGWTQYVGMLAGLFQTAR